MTIQQFSSVVNIFPAHERPIADSTRRYYDLPSAEAHRPLSFLIMAALILVLTACASDPPPIDSVTAVNGRDNAVGEPESYETVDCLLPGQIRQLGTQMAYVTERSPVRTTKEDCTIRDGEYVSKDPAK